MRKKFKYLLTCLLITCLLFSLSSFCFADDPTDEVLNFDITVDVNEDATLNILYHIEWKVLDSDSLGPLNWVNIGIPNGSYKSIEGLSDSIKSISYSSDSGPSVKIVLDRDYYENEIAVMDYLVVQDSMYQVDKLTEGETVYSFTPAWFNGIAVDSISIKWNINNAVHWSPECSIEDGFLVWRSSLGPDEKFTVAVTYPNEAYAFDLSHQIDNQSSTYEGSGSFIIDLIAWIIAICLIILPFALIGFVIYAVGKGFSSAVQSRPEKKITRTLVKYYDSCPGCGAVRKDGQTKCEYCGRSLIQSEEVLEEKEVDHPNRYTKEGEYSYPSVPDSYIRVHVVTVPRPVYVSSRSGSGSRSSSSSSSYSGRSSSCACVSSCACACACACAGSGRAGCSTKDFYKTNLKLSQIKLQK